jgi:hypothetical protein
MTDQHPITPPPELVEKWHDTWIDAKVKHDGLMDWIAAEAAQWGADQELEACCEWVNWKWSGIKSRELRATRRPKPPSLKEQALAVVENSSFCDHLSKQDEAILRRALEALPND